MSGNAAKILSGPGGYALVIVVGGVALYVLYKAIANNIVAPIGNAAQGAYTGLQNFDNNVGLGGFDAWVSSLFKGSDGATTPP